MGLPSKGVVSVRKVPRKAEQAKRKGPLHTKRLSLLHSSKTRTTARRLLTSTNQPNAYTAARATGTT